MNEKIDKSYFSNEKYRLRNFIFNKGRIGRLGYFYIGIIHISILIFSFAMVMSGLISFGIIPILLSLTIAIAILAIIRRLHDIGYHSILHLIGCLIPLVGLYYAVILHFAKSVPTKESYGLIKNKMTKPVHFFTLIFFITSLACLVFLPKPHWQRYSNTFYSVKFPGKPTAVENAVSKKLIYSDNFIVLRSSVYVNFQNTTSESLEKAFGVSTVSGLITINQKEFIEDFINLKSSNYKVLLDKKFRITKDNVHGREIILLMEDKGKKYRIQYKLFIKSDYLYTLEAFSRAGKTYEIDRVKRFLHSFKFVNGSFS